MIEVTQYNQPDIRSDHPEQSILETQCWPLLLLLLLLSRFSCVRLCATRWTSAHQAPASLILQARTLEWGAIAFSNSHVSPNLPVHPAHTFPL